MILILFWLVLPNMTVQEHAGNEKSCVWHARDYADGELKDELFCIRFASIESKHSFNLLILKIVLFLKYDWTCLFYRAFKCIFF